MALGSSRAGREARSSSTSPRAADRASGPQRTSTARRGLPTGRGSRGRRLAASWSSRSRQGASGGCRSPAPPRSPGHRTAGRSRRMAPPATTSGASPSSTCARAAPPWSTASPPARSAASWPGPPTAGASPTRRPAGRRRRSGPDRELPAGPRRLDLGEHAVAVDAAAQRGHAADDPVEGQEGRVLLAAGALQAVGDLLELGQPRVEHAQRRPCGRLAHARRAGGDGARRPGGGHRARERRVGLVDQRVAGGRRLGSRRRRGIGLLVLVGLTPAARHPAGRERGGEQHEDEQLVGAHVRSASSWVASVVVPTPRRQRMADSPLHKLSAAGQSVWIDFLSRPLLRDGELERLIRDDAVVGVTSNPTIFQKAISSGDAYDDQLREVLDDTEDPKEVFLQLAVRDVQEACDVLRETYDSSGGVDGFVSLEVDPEVAFDSDATEKEAERLHGWVDRPNVYIKIPATQDGLSAIEKTIGAGIPVNVTLIFGLDRYRAVAEAYLKGLEHLVESGGDPSKVPSVASFFVSRVDTEADKRLDDLGGHDELRGKLAIANAKLAYKAYKEIFSGERWEKLEAKGAKRQRCLWASTSVKDEHYRDTMYVEDLVGPDTVDTMPPETIKAFQDHGKVEPGTLERDVDGAKKVFDGLRDAGIDYDDIIATLEKEGVEKFSDSFKQLLDDVKAERDELATATR